MFVRGFSNHVKNHVMVDFKQPIRFLSGGKWAKFFEVSIIAPHGEPIAAQMAFYVQEVNNQQHAGAYLAEENLFNMFCFTYFINDI